MAGKPTDKKEDYSKLLERNKVLGGSNSSLDYHHASSASEDADEKVPKASLHKATTGQDESKNNMGNQGMSVAIEDKELQQKTMHHPNSPTRTLGMERMRRSRKRSPAPRRVLSPARHPRHEESPKSPRSPKPKRIHRRASGERKPTTVEKPEQKKHQEKHHHNHHKHHLHNHQTFEERVAASAEASALAAAALAAVALRIAFPEVEYSEEEMDLGDMVVAATSASHAAVEAARLLSQQARDIQKSHATRQRRTKELREPALERANTH